MQFLFGVFEIGRIVLVVLCRGVAHRFQFGQFLLQLRVSDLCLQRCEGVVVALLWRETFSGKGGGAAEGEQGNRRGFC
jgi:hypothetical protein